MGLSDRHGSELEWGDSETAVWGEDSVTTESGGWWECHIAQLDVSNRKFLSMMQMVVRLAVRRLELREKRKEKG